MGIFHSRVKQTEDPEDFHYKRFSPWPPVQPVEKQSTPTSDTSSLATLVTVGTAFVLANVLLAIALKPDRPKLENDPMCGITTGGKVTLSKNLILNSRNDFILGRVLL